MTKNQSPVPFSNNAANINFESLHAIRNHLANTAIISSVIIAFLLVGISLFRAIFIGWQDVMTLHLVILLAALVLVSFYKRFAYGIRAFLIPAILFIAGSAGLYSLGL